MKYRCVTTSIRGFIQQLATCYLRHGYWWYVTGTIPEHKEPEQIDQLVAAIRKTASELF